jgi:hypothetical protein
MKRNILVFGTVAGVLVATFMAISMFIMSRSTDAEHGANAMIIGFASMVVAFSLVFVGIKNYRDRQNGGSLGFGEGLLLGFMISLVASTIYVATWAVEFHYYLPDFMDKYAAAQIKHTQESGISGMELENAVREIQTDAYNYKHNPLVFTLYTYAEILPVGIIITLISALILKRKRPALAS